MQINIDISPAAAEKMVKDYENNRLLYCRDTIQKILEAMYEQLPVIDNEQEALHDILDASSIAEPFTADPEIDKQLFENGDKNE